MRRLAAILALLVASCGADGFDLPLSGTISIPADGNREVTGPLPSIEGLTSVDLGKLPAMHDAGIDAAKVTTAKLKKLSLTAEDDATVDFLEYVELYVEGAGEPKVKIGDKHVPDGARTVDLDIDNVEMAPYLAASRATLSGTATRRGPSKDLRVRLDAVVHVSGTGLPF